MKNAEQKKGVSLGLWVPLIWYALASSRGVSRWFYPEFDPQNLNYLEGTPLDRAVFIGLMVVGVLILARRKVDWAQVGRNNVWIVLLFFYMGMSLFWSDFMGVALRRWIKAIGDLVMVLIVLTEADPLEAVSTLLRRCFYLIIPLSVITIKYYRPIGVVWNYLEKESWIGVTTHKNSLGQVAMISGVYFIWNIIRGRGKRLWVDFLLLIMTLWLLRGPDASSSKTSIVIFFVGLGLLLVLHLMRSNLTLTKRFTVIVIFLVTFSSLMIPFATYSSLVSSTIEAIGRDKTLTDRSDLWADLFNIASLHPFVGVGYGSFWIGDLTHNLWEKHTWMPKQGHNGYIDVYLELGWVGLVLLIGVIVVAYKSILKMFEFNAGLGKLQLILLTMVLLNNITESSFLRGANNLWFVFLLSAVRVLAPSSLPPIDPSLNEEESDGKVDALA
jgi:exopolysaccharide production protein ExoQ